MSGLTAALAFYTRLPIRKQAQADDSTRSAPWFPVVGLAIGATIASGYVVSSALLPHLLAAVLAVSAGMALTGAFDEDGLGDVADAFAGAWTIERRLEILDDPRQGTFGVLALSAAFVARVGAISS
ncbi:MAG: adenosylcobinamide-GDP ribazoletransferase, partial [Actinomycetota bacterium]